MELSTFANDYMPKVTMANATSPLKQPVRPKDLGPYATLLWERRMDVPGHSPICLANEEDIGHIIKTLYNSSKGLGQYASIKFQKSLLCISNPIVDRG